MDTVDEKVLESIRTLQREGNSDLLNIVIEAISRRPLGFYKPSKSCGKGRWGGTQKGSHSLKSSSANVGPEAFLLCKELETMGQEKSMQQAALLLPRRSWNMKSYKKFKCELKRRM